LDAIDKLKTQRTNFAIVTNDLNKSVGLITLKQIFDRIVLKKFKDDDIRVHIHLNKNVRIDSVMEAK
jgi:CBS domain containing-hemolysin-like protein